METEETAVGTHNICVRNQAETCFPSTSKTVWTFRGFFFWFKCGIREISYSLHSYHNDFDVFYKSNFL